MYQIVTIKKHFLTLLFFILFAFGNIHTLSGQSATKVASSIIHLDKSFYVAGEIIWYNLYLPTALTDKAIVIKAGILDPTGNLQHSSFLPSEGKTTIEGYYQIPFNQASGVYYLQFSAINKSSKLPVNLVTTTIPIYNDLEGVAQTVSNSQAIPTPPTNPIANELDISIQLPKGKFNHREKIQPTITIKDKSGKTVAANLSVSITDMRMVGDYTTSPQNIQTGNEFNPALASILGNNIYLNGKAKAIDGQAYPDKVLGAYVPMEDKLIYAKSNKSGNFLLNVPEFYGQKSFQILGQEADELVKISPARQQIKIVNKQKLSFSETVKNYLAVSRQRKKIFQYYGALEAKLETKENIITTKGKVLGPDVDYIINEYEDFEYMSIFFKENFTPLRFFYEKKDSTYTAKMYHPKNQSSENKFYSGKPLLIIDDIVTRDGNFLARMRTSDVEKVELYYDLKKLNKQYKIFGSSGVTKITTYDKFESLPVFEAKNVLTINGFQKKSSFPIFDPASINGDRHQPFFRPQLYWNANLSTQKNGQTTFSYFQSDDRSIFQIQVVAQSKDGKIGYQTIQYTVN